ncbi:hypothetical protein L7F22_045599 [Adiantum nelumboides]|nr:hypothetical protein [Adiantum nelumboides]
MPKAVNGSVCLRTPRHKHAVQEVNNMARLKAEARSYGTLAEQKRGRPRKSSDEASTQGQKVMEVSVTNFVGDADIDAELLQRMDDFLRMNLLLRSALERGGMEHDSSPSHVEETQSGEMLEGEVECPVQRLQNILVQVLEEACDNRRSLHSLATVSIDGIRSTIGQQQVDLLDSELTQFHEELALLLREINNLKV